MVSLTEIEICGEETGFLLSFEVMRGKTGRDETGNGNQKREAKGEIEKLKTVHLCLAYECGSVGIHKLTIFKSPPGLSLQGLRI